MYRILLCDDNQDFLNILEDRVRDYYSGKDVIVKTVNDSDILVTLIEKNQLFDAYFLDIEMQDYSGIEVARMIKQRSQSAAIIFLTAFSVYAVEACGMYIFRYVLKERFETELPLVLDDLYKYLQCLVNEKRYQIVNKRKCISFFQKEIIYITKEQKNAVFHKVDGTREYDRQTLREVYQKLANELEMCFVDRGIIINLFHVCRVETDRVVLSNGEKIYFNSAQISNIKRKITLYWGDII